MENLAYGVFLLIVGILLQFRGFIMWLLKTSNAIRGSATQITETSIRANRGIGIIVLVLALTVLVLEIF